MEGREWIVSGFVLLLLPENSRLALVSGTEGAQAGLGVTICSRSLPEPGAAHPCQLQAMATASAPGLWGKYLPSLHIPTAVAQTRPHLEQCSLPIFLAEEPCAPACHRCQQTPPAAPLHGPTNGLVVKNFSIKNESKSLNKNSKHLMTL